MKSSLKPIIVLVSVLFVVILVIPTIIVVPFSEKKASGELTEERTTNPETTQIASGPTVDVAVYRSSLDSIENVPLEEYVIGVLSSEMPADFELEALKAQSIAARTYIVKQMLSDENVGTPEGATVSDTVMHQVYKNKDELKNLWGKDYSWKMEKITEAVYATQGQILTYDGQPITASFFSTSNGFTENSEDYWQNPIPYLKSVESPWDVNSPKFTSEKSIPVSQFEKSLGIKVGDSKDLGKVTRTKSNRVEKIVINGKTFSGRDIRTHLDLQSTDFTWKRVGDEIIVTTKGYGHGVGMSQYGANGMAQEGKNYEQILTHYYNGVEIASADSFINKITAAKK